MFTHTPHFHQLLEKTLGLKVHYVEVEGGAIPVFVREGKYGKMANSLPFYGSHGGFLIDPAAIHSFRVDVVRQNLKNSFDCFLCDEDCLLSTMIESPLVYNAFDGDYVDDRRLQMTPLHHTPDPKKEILENVVEKRNRASIKRPLRNNIEVVASQDFEPLYEMHEANMGTICAPPKPKVFFDSIPDTIPDDAYSLTYALKKGRIIAGLLLFYFKDFVEYFTPATDVNYRKEQGLSLLIFEAMAKAIRDGYHRWNWGGTSYTGQDGVYRFKKGWGAVDWYYRYHTMAHGDIGDVLDASKEELLTEYPFFYVIPFAEVNR